MLGSIAVLLLMLGANGYLIFLELREDAGGQNRIAPAEQKVRHDMARQDPLLDVRFASSEREANAAKSKTIEDRSGLHGACLASQRPP